jgi:hypothetical protein
MSSLRTGKSPIFNIKVTLVPLSTTYSTTEHNGGARDPHSTEYEARWLSIANRIRLYQVRVSQSTKYPPASPTIAAATHHGTYTYVERETEAA